MGRLKEALASVLAEAKFDLGKAEQGRNGPSIRYARIPDEVALPGELRVLAVRQGRHDEATSLARCAKVIVPDEQFTEWLSAIKELLGNYINQETGKIGHAFPMEFSNQGYTTFEAEGVTSQAYVSSVDDFARVLIRGAAIMGTAKLLGIQRQWLEQQSVRYFTSAILNGVYLADKLEPLPGIRIEPLPRSTDGEFGSLPVRRGSSIGDYLGRTMLKVESIARPAFYRPQEGDRGSVVGAKFATDIGLETVCQALALEANSKVEMAFEWNDYEEASLYLSPSSRSFHSRGHRGGIDSRGVGFSVRTDFASGVRTLSIEEQNITGPTEGRVGDIILAIAEGKHEKIDIAVSRWCKSKESFRTLADQFIDLRIALECLYLKDFRGEHSQEMRFRLAVFGAWHLGRNYEERREIRRTLRKAYDVASAAVHSGDLEVNEENRRLLSQSQKRCREGILKLLNEGAPGDWGELILGSNLEDSTNR